jgi:hypothetical protein
MLKLNNVIFEVFRIATQNNYSFATLRAILIDKVKYTKLKQKKLFKNV